MIKRVYWLYIAVFVILEWSKVPIKDLLRHHFYSKITRLGLPWPWIWVAGSVLFFLLVASHFPVKMNWTILKVTERKLVLFSLTQRSYVLPLFYDYRESDLFVNHNCFILLASYKDGLVISLVVILYVRIWSTSLQISKPWPCITLISCK